MANRLAIEERRRQVWAMYIRGVPETVIAKAMGVHRNTIFNDVKVLKRRNANSIDTAKANFEVGDLIAKLDEVFKMSMEECVLAERPGVKAAMMSRAMHALKEKAEIMFRAGVIPEAAKEVNERLTIEGVDLKRASLDELKELRKKLLERAGIMRN